MPEFLSSKTIITEAPPQTRAIPASAAAVAGIVGVGSWGPINESVQCDSFPEYQDRFGGYAVHQDPKLTLSVQAYFANGGGRLHVVRTASYKDPSQRDSCQAKTASAAVVSAVSNTDREQAANEDGEAFEARYPGAYGTGLRVDIKPSTAKPDGVDVFISRDQVRLEQWLGLSPDSLPQTLNRESRYVRVRQPNCKVQPETTLMLTGGEDGAAASDADYTGDARARTGLHALDRVLDLSILVLSGGGPEAQRQALLYCEGQRKGWVFALLDIPQGKDAQAAREYVEGERLEGSTEHGAIYWPHLRVSNPAPRLLAGDWFAVPPAPFLAGILGRLAASRPGGVYLPPAGIEAGQIAWATGLDEDDALDEAKRDLVFPTRINPITTGPGLPVYVDGSRTLRGDGACPWVAHRRGLSYIARNLKVRVDYLRHRPLNSALEAEGYREANSYLRSQMEVDAFASKNPKEAYALRVTRNPAGRFLYFGVGCAQAVPGEFAWIEFSVLPDVLQGV